MDEQTLFALKGSIAKWESIVAGTGTNEGTENCPLCHLFHSNYAAIDKNCCDGCPVFAKTGRRACMGTPYIEYDDNPTKENAQREVDFLKSLLPPAAQS
jgi:hypothetical protein